jgi:transposase
MHLYTKTKGGKEYFYLRETKRVDGKVVCSFQKYIGNKEKLFQVIQDGLNPISHVLKPDKSEVYSFGAVAVLHKLCDQISLQSIINENLPKRKQGMNPSDFLILAAINRAIDAKSKNSIAEWIASTSLAFIMNGVKPKQITAQNFWNHMDRIDSEQIYAMENQITRKVVKQYNLKLDSLLYDSTNFFSYIHSFNEKPTIEQRGHNKQKRVDLRQANFALLATKDHHIPLYHQVYDGNTNDFESFKNTVVHLKNKVDLIGNKNELTLVFDSGNVSKNSMDLIRSYGLKFISKLKPSNYKPLLDVPLEEYETMSDPGWEGKRIYFTKQNIYGDEKLVAIRYCQKHFESEYTTFNNHITKVKADFLALKTRLKGYQSSQKLPANVNIETVKNLCQKAFQRRSYLKSLIKFEVNEIDGFPELTWEINQDDIEKYAEIHFGKTIYFSNNEHLSAKEIIETYSYQHRIEKLFKISKNRRGGCWWPKYHWTNQKIKVHAFYCYLALLLLSLLQLEASKLKINVESHNIISQLSKIYEITDHYKNKKYQHISNKRHSTLNAVQKKLFKHFDLKSYF